MTLRRSEIHMHSTFSDGEFSPAGLVDIGKKNGVSILSLTDHDTFVGIEEFIGAANKACIYAFPGIEITVTYRDFNLHLLAYFKSIDSIKPDLRARVEKMKAAREKRMHELIAKIDGVIPEKFQGTIKFENVAKAAEGVLARPHLAREMTRLGIVESTREAFDKYLVKHNVEKDNLSMEEALQLLRRSGGIPVLAHPGERNYSLYNPQRGRDYSDIPPMLEELCALGLMGLECVYPYHERIGKVDYYKSLAKDFELIATGSRDFHGFNTHQNTDLFGTTDMDDTFLYRFEEEWNNVPV